MVFYLFSIASQTFSEVKLIKKLTNKLTIEIVNGHCELALLQDGTLQIPYNVDINILIQFLKDNLQKSLQLKTNMLKQKVVFYNIFQRFLGYF